MTKRYGIIAALLLVVIFVTLVAGCSIIPTVTKTTPGPDVIKQAWDIIKKNYVDTSKLDSANMSGAAIKGLVDSLQDPYSAYLTPEELKAAQNNFAGSYVGIGAVITIVDGKVTIVGIFPNSTAEKAGLKENDIIQAVDGQSTDNMTADQVSAKIRGSTPSVQLTILHPGAAAPMTLTLNINTVNVPSVSLEMRDGCAYIVITQFTGRTGTEFAAIMPKLKTNNAQGVILDLRNNPGGILDDVVEVANHFITSGIIVQVRSRQGVVSVMNAKSGYESTSLPTVVLVNQYSASGSEVLSGALQDRNRALIAGNTTYGKGSVDILFQLADGSGIYLTSERWLTPNGNLIEGHGITPDVKLDLAGDDMVNWAINYLKTGQH
jgi:carboxyl-terminal processing protease